MNLKEILESKEYRDLVKEKLDKITQKIEEKGVYSLKSNPIIQIYKDGNFNVNFFIDNIPLIWLKFSKLNAGYRDIIKAICNECLIEYKEKYAI